ncbi:penicillin-binding protein activator [Vibrio marisflavi]|uniref:Penicillin-binding protein activator LpoA n=1 Tax=Vibrio marisflavi CECT 7928 TaxID=634439 RepID=A0ABN8E823_9VIBR|nr:penicillin-binding protein activator [Vibrio marisflavi]CAH0541307.1 Penicillin-binding protein activator LpoA [Vibrio marisflavi CECT 7928]
MAIKNHKKISVTRLLTPVVITLTLAACSSVPTGKGDFDITPPATESAQTYIMRADASVGTLQNDWLVMALKASIKADNKDQTKLLLTRLSKQKLDKRQQAEIDLTLANQLIRNQEYQKALDTLDFKLWWKLQDVQWKEYHEYRAKAFTGLNDYFQASRELVLLSDYLPQDDQAKVATEIWHNLNKYSAQDITQLSAKPNEDILDGWLQLAIYMKTLANNIPQLQNTLKHWLAENSHHPAAIYTPKDIQDVLSLKFVKPVHTALLLPLTGKFSKQAQLIRDGFILEMLNDKDRNPNATLTIVDTNSDNGQAIADTLKNRNIDFIVGPLLKNNVEKLQQLQEQMPAPIPTLALNIPEQIDPNIDTCYVALSPEQEVAQGAKHLYELGYKYPLILAPQGSFGDRVVQAFKNEWQKYSTDNVAVSQFGDKRELQKNINNVFGLQASQQRIAQMDRLMSIPLQSQPRSRRDIDAVYIVANSSQLTLIKPFIEVAVNPDATPPKLFANSTSNSGNTRYEDLSGIAYSDIPMIVNPTPALSDEMSSIWPKSTNSEKRLQALGMDAYQLMEKLPQMKVIDGYTIDGETGVLSINKQCVVQREINWAVYGAE